jgi:hypothetical protein
MVDFPTWRGPVTNTELLVFIALASNPSIKRCMYIFASPTILDYKSKSANAVYDTILVAAQSIAILAHPATYPKG